MAWQDKLALLFGNNPQTAGLLGEEGSRAAAMQGLLGAGASLLEASGPSLVPTSTAQALGGAIRAGQQGFQGAAQSQIGMQDLQQQRQTLEEERAARQELEALLASGNVTDEALLRIATRFPQAQNVIQQYMKGRQMAATGAAEPGEVVTRQLPNGDSVYWDGKRWQYARQQAAPQQRVNPYQQRVDAMRQLGIPDEQIAAVLSGTAGKATAKGGEPAKTAAGAERPGNPRARGAARTGAESAYRYASALTGIPADELRAMSPDDLEKAVVEKGGRLFQGPIMGELPFASNRINSDIVADVEAMAAQQAQVWNETGIVTKPDVDSARATVANPKQPIEVQAARLRAMIEQNQLYNPVAPAAPAAGAANVPPAAAEHLRRNPSLRAQFDAKYGAGAAASVLGE